MCDFEVLRDLFLTILTLFDTRSIYYLYIKSKIHVNFRKTFTSECKNQFDAYQKLSKSGVFSNWFPVKLIELIENVDAVVNMQPTFFRI